MTYFLFILAMFLPLGLAPLYRYFDEAQERSRNNRWVKGWHCLKPSFLNSKTAHNNKNRNPKWLWSMVLISFTDGEHLFQGLKNWTIAIAVGLPGGATSVVIIYWLYRIEALWLIPVYIALIYLFMMAFGAYKEFVLTKKGWQ